MKKFKGRQIHVIKNGKKRVMSPNDFYAKNESKSKADLDLDMDWYASNGYISLDDFIKEHPVNDKN